MVYQETFSEDIAITNRERTEQPQISIKAKVRKDTFLSDIFLGLDAGFTRHGAIRVEINEVPFFESQEPNAFRRYQTFPIGTNNKILRNGERIKIWAWSLNGTTLNLTATVSISEERFEAGKNPDSINELLVSRLLSDNPEVSSDTSVIVDGLQAVQDALSSLDVDLEDGSIVTALTDILNNLPSNPDNAGIIAALNMVIDNLPESPNNADIIQAIEDLERALPPDTDSGVINAIRDLEETVMAQVVNLNDTNIVNSITALQAALPESPDNAQTHADLEAILAGLPDSPSNADVVAALTALQTSLPEDLHDDLDAIVDSINNQTTDLTLPADDDLTLTSTRSEIMLAIGNASGDYAEALTLIVTALDAAEAQFDQNSLDNLIDIITINLPVVRNNNLPLHTKLTAALNRLRQIHQTAPVLRSSDESALFPHRVYDNEYHTALLNLKGSKNMIIVINSGPAIDPTSFFTQDPSVPFQVAGTVTPSMTWGPWHNFFEGFDYVTEESRTFGLSFDIPDDFIIRTSMCRTSIAYRRYRDFRIEEGFQRQDQYQMVNATAVIPLHPTNIDAQISPLLDGTEASTFTLTGDKRYWGILHRVRLRPFRRIILTREFTYRTPAGLTTTPCGTEADSFDTPEIPSTEIPLNLIDRSVGEDAFMQLSAQVRDSNFNWHDYILPTEISPQNEGKIFVNEDKVIQFGELLNGKLLPSSDSLFRMAIRVMGRMRTGVDVIRVG